MTRTVADVVAATASPHRGSLPAPEYLPDTGRPEPPSAVGLCVPSMRRHTTDEGWQLFEGLCTAGWDLAGYGVIDACAGGGWLLSETEVPAILNHFKPTTVLLQDKREWTGRTAGPGFDQRERFQNVGALWDRDDVFKLTVLKDAHSDHLLHQEAATEIAAHAWVIYYHPDIVAAQAPFVRREHLVRTWHSVDADAVPPFKDRDRSMGLLSGAVSKAYPLRSRLALACRNGQMHHVHFHKHPGYRRDGCLTPHYLSLLNQHKVAVCTSSRFGYAVRKIVEATACGCVVVTDLPVDEHLPEIDGNLIRVHPDASPAWVDELVRHLCVTWDADRQRVWADRAKRFYDFRSLGKRLAADIEALRRRYNEPPYDDLTEVQ